MCIVYREREQPPRFAQPGSFEYEYAMRWKALIEMEKQQQDQVDRNIKEAREKLEMEMEAARHEHQVMLMRQGEWRPVSRKSGMHMKCQFCSAVVLCSLVEKESLHLYSLKYPSREMSLEMGIEYWIDSIKKEMIKA